MSPCTKSDINTVYFTAGKHYLEGGRAATGGCFGGDKKKVSWVMDKVDVFVFSFKFHSSCHIL